MVPKPAPIGAIRLSAALLQVLLKQILIVPSALALKRWGFENRNSEF